MPSAMRTLTLGLLIVATASAAPACRIEIVEKGSGWPVPLVELRTTHQVAFVSDNAGVIALDAPELLGRETWFEVHGHGYGVPKDGFGFSGVRLTPAAGKTLRIEVARTIVARRLGRLTGAGLFSESEKLDSRGAARESGVVGCDSVQLAAHRGRLHWFWGDTVVARYPLGIFDASGATTSVGVLRSMEPPLRLEFDYFTNAEGRPRGVAPMPGQGPTWLTAVISLPDARGEPKLCASYLKVKPPLDVYERGLCVWNEDTRRFEPRRVIWTKSDASPAGAAFPEGHAVIWRDGAGKSWVLFGNPLPRLRCPARFEAWQDPSTWVTLAPQDTLRAAADAGPVKPHSGSIAWNAWRQRWVTVFLQAFGQPSALGELWYAEAREPTGPWGNAVKVLSHDNYTFYNPRVHPELSPANSPVLLFEGTYTKQFANHAAATPRYDYNQILYRLDLDDSALKPAQQP